MIYFKTIRWKNLLSTGNVFTEIDLSSDDMVLINGINGAGKSTILDALTFGLFGKPFRKVNKPQLLNSITQKNLLVELEFSIGSIQYMIRRGIKPDVFEVYQNGNLLNQSAEKRDYQAILEKQILKLKYKTFCQVVILGSATFQPFMQLASGQRREIIEDLLDLQIFTTMNALLKDKTLRNSEAIQKVQNDKRVIESKIELTKQHLLEMQQDVEKQIEDKKKQIINLDSDKAIKMQELHDCKELLDGLMAQVRDDSKTSVLLGKLNKLRGELDNKVKRLNTEINFFNENETCPTCKQPIHEEFKNDALTSKTSELEEVRKGITVLMDQYNSTDAELKSIQEHNVALNREINDHKMESVRLVTSIDNIEKQCRKLEKEIQILETKQSQQTNTKIDEFEVELRILDKDNIKLVEDREVLAIAATLLKDQGIKARIIKQYIPIINKLINKYLSELELFVEFELDENFNESIKSRYRDNFTYASFSEGEKQKIDLALLFTWRAIAKLRNSVSTNLLILDEVFDSSLDTNSTDYLMNIFRNIAKDSNIFVISHREQMNEKFPKVISFVKNKNFSSIRE